MNNVNPEQPFEPTAELWVTLYKTKDNIFHLIDKKGEEVLSGKGSNMLEWIFNEHKNKTTKRLDMVLVNKDEYLEAAMDMAFNKEHNIYAGFIIPKQEVENES